MVVGREWCKLVYNYLFVLMVLPPILNWAETVRLTPAKKAKDNKIFFMF